MIAPRDTDSTDEIANNDPIVQRLQEELTKTKEMLQIIGPLEQQHYVLKAQQLEKEIVKAKQQASDQYLNDDIRFVRLPKEMSSKHQIKLAKKDWIAIGDRMGWIKQSQGFDETIKDIIGPDTEEDQRFAEQLQQSITKKRKQIEDIENDLETNDALSEKERKYLRQVRRYLTTKIIRTIKFLKAFESQGPLTHFDWQQLNNPEEEYEEPFRQTIPLSIDDDEEQIEKDRREFESLQQSASKR